VCTEAGTVLRAIAADFFFNCWYLEISADNRVWHVPTIMRKVFDWKIPKFLCKNAYRILENPEGKRPRHRWEDNIKISFRRKIGRRGLN
jgi:hypothetical protein